jgi:hypothetical protein
MKLFNVRLLHSKRALIAPFGSTGAAITRHAVVQFKLALVRAPETRYQRQCRPDSHGY